MDSKDLPLQVGVKVLLKNKENQYLLLRRNPKAYPDMKAVWDIAGGRIQVNMPLFENLQREVMEETGLSLEAAPRLVAAQDIIRPDKHVVRFTYVGEIEGDPRVDEDHLEAQWFAADEVKGLELDSFLRELIQNGTVELLV